MVPFIKLAIFILYSLSSLFYIFFFLNRETKRKKMGRIFFIIAFSLQFFFIIFVVSKIGYIPFSNGINALSFSGFLVAAAYLLMTLFSKSDSFSFLIVPFVAISQFLYIFTEKFPSKLSGIFDSSWFQIHVSFALLSFSSFLFGFIASVLYLMLYRELERKNFGRFYFGLDSLDELNKNLTYSTLLGVIFLIFAIYTGHGWLNEVKGSVRGISTRIYASYFTLLVYTTLLFLKFGKRVSGKKISLLSMMGFFLMVVAFAFGGTH